MALDDFGTDGTNPRYTDEDIVSQLEEIASEFGRIDSTLINEYADFAHGTVSERFGDGKLEDALVNLGFSDCADITPDSYKSEDVLYYIREFHYEYGYFSVNEFKSNPNYPSDRPLRDHFGSVKDAVSAAGVTFSSYRGHKQRHEALRKIAINDIQKFYDYDDYFAEVPMSDEDMDDRIISDIVLADGGGNMVAAVEVKATYSDYKKNVVDQVSKLSGANSRVVVFTLDDIYNAFRDIKSELNSMSNVDVLVVKCSDIDNVYGDGFWATHITDYSIEMA